MFEGLLRRRPVVAKPIGSERAAACAAIHGPAFAHAWSEAEFESLLASSACLADGAFEGGGDKLLGFALSRCAGDEAELLTIAVAPSARRRGAARALLAAHLRRLADRGVARLFLEVAEDNAAALALYRGAGFAEAGRRAGYYRRADGPPGNALVLRRDLE
ncbi:MAG: GNAT family N-acetyltransferase [Methylobacteriaceae bacterium]|nr:GNAT family N-acetyltransferase [Methylobacteriaceae bacterium]